MYISPVVAEGGHDADFGVYLAPPFVRRTPPPSTSTDLATPIRIGGSADKEGARVNFRK